MQVSNVRRFWGATTAAALCLLTIVATSTSATAAACPGQVVSGTHTAAQDYETNSTISSCIDVRNGANVNMNGHSITCTNPSGCAPAIDCSQDATVGSLIQSNVHNDGDHVDISGPFSIAVNECQQVQDLVIEGADTAIANNAKTMNLVSGNVLRDCGTACIDAKMTADGHNISHNFIEPLGANAIHIIGKASGTGPRIDHNVISQFDVGIFNSDSTVYRLENNVLYDGVANSTPISVGGGAAKTNNVCENDTDCACDLLSNLGNACLAP